MSWIIYTFIVISFAVIYMVGSTIIKNKRTADALEAEQKYLREKLNPISFEVYDELGKPYSEIKLRVGDTEMSYAGIKIKGHKFDCCVASNEVNDALTKITEMREKD